MKILSSIIEFIRLVQKVIWQVENLLSIGKGSLKHLQLSFQVERGEKKEEEKTMPPSAALHS